MQCLVMLVIHVPAAFSYITADILYRRWQITQYVHYRLDETDAIDASQNIDKLVPCDHDDCLYQKDYALI